MVLICVKQLLFERFVARPNDSYSRSTLLDPFLGALFAPQVSFQIQREKRHVAEDAVEAQMLAVQRVASLPGLAVVVVAPEQAADAVVLAVALRLPHCPT